MNRLILLTGLIGLGVAGCAVPPVPVTGGASVRFTIRQLPAPDSFGVMRLPGQSRLDHYTFTLLRGIAIIQGPTSVATGVNPVTRTISNITTGNGYRVEVNAVDANGDTVATGVGTSALFDVVGTNVYDNAGDPGHATPLDTATTPLAISITLTDGAFDDGPTVTVADTAAAGDKAGISLLNVSTWRAAGVTAKAVDAGPTNFTITQVGVGATTGTSHRLYSYFADTNNEATVAKPQDVSGDGDGIIDTTTINLTHSMTQNPADTGLDELTGGRMVASSQNRVYVLDNGGLNITRADNGATTTLGGPTATVHAVRTESGGSDAFYFAATDDQLYSNAGSGGGPLFTPLVDLSGVGGTAGITSMSVDAGGNLYWMDGGAVKRLPQGGAIGDITTPIAAGVGVTELAVDALGNLYYGDGGLANIYLASYDPDLDSYSNTNKEVTVATGGLITNLTCDAAGNLYFLDGAGAGNLKMHALGNATTVYKVTGTAGFQANRPAVGFNGTLFYVDGGNNLMRL